MAKKTYKVPDMMCAHCVKTINDALKNAGFGFFSRKVDLQTKTVTVTDKGVDVAKILADAGFPAEEA